MQEDVQDPHLGYSKTFFDFNAKMPGYDLNESLFSTHDFPKFRKKSWVEIEKNH